MSKKDNRIFVCQSCNHQVSKWMGKCNGCGEWNSLVEEKMVARQASLQKELNLSKVFTLNQIPSAQYERFQSGVFEFDRVLGGGIVPGSLTLIGGEPGVGKSTLLLNIVAQISKQNPIEKILYISGEESIEQIADRAQRLSVKSNEILLFNETSFQKIKDTISIVRPQFVVLDSIQTTISEEIGSPPGSLSQIREITYELMNYAKSKQIAVFLVGHITKDGGIAGPKLLEHMVDTVIYFEGSQLGQYRILRAIKNRFGNTSEVGIFEMTTTGLREVANPGTLFLDDNLRGAVGRSLCCVVEGTRPLFIEIQSLVVENKFGNGRRNGQGVDIGRVSMLIAIVEKYFSIPLGFNDIFINIVGGFKVDGRDADLGLIASMISSYMNKVIPEDVLFVGEVGLSGEVRSLPQIESRIKEAVTLNYKKMITSKKVAEEFSKKYKIELVGISRVWDLKAVI